MTEDVLQYIWQTQSFNKAHLLTVTGEPVSIFRQGDLNNDSGPDFSSARLAINEVEWIGDVEIHIKTSSWHSHKHHLDPAYNKVILHVVWEHDTPAIRNDGSEIPTLELKHLIGRNWLRKYESLSASLFAIPCEPFFAEVQDIYKLGALNKVLIERLKRKSSLLLKELNRLNGDWEQATVGLLFENFGFKKNNEAFKQLASITDYKIFRKLSTLKQMEAYLLGMAGFLAKEKHSSSYHQELKDEFLWLTKKYNFSSKPMSATWWKFMRLRPANFPTQRLAQLASLLFHRKHLFQTIIDVMVKEAPYFFKVETSEFWQTHYHFNKTTHSALRGIGEQSARLLSINVAAVLLIAYGQYTNNERYTKKALNFLETIRPEENVITRRWSDLGIKLASAADSQGAIELFNNYCKNKKCLRCNIGNQILQGT